MEFYTQRIVKTASDESKKLVKLTPEIKLAMTKIGRGKYKSKTSGIEWGIVDIDGVPHLARLENEESKEKVASFIQRTKSAADPSDDKGVEVTKDDKGIYHIIFKGETGAAAFSWNMFRDVNESEAREAIQGLKPIGYDEEEANPNEGNLYYQIGDKLLVYADTIAMISTAPLTMAQFVKNLQATPLDKQARRTIMNSKKAMQPFGAGEPGPVEHNVEFSDMGENDPTVDMLTMADQFESPESLIAEIAIKYNMSDEEAMSLFEDVKEYVNKFSATIEQRIVTAWLRF